MRSSRLIFAEKARCKNTFFEIDIISEEFEELDELDELMRNLTPLPKQPEPEYKKRQKAYRKASYQRLRDYRKQSRVEERRKRMLGDSVS